MDESLHVPSVMMSLICLVPAPVYCMPIGFSCVDVAGEAPLPKFQLYVHAPPVVPVLVKDTESSSQLGAVVVKFAVGVALIVIVCELLSLHWALLTVKVTVLLPLLE